MSQKELLDIIQELENEIEDYPLSEVDMMSIMLTPFIDNYLSLARNIDSVEFESMDGSILSIKLVKYSVSKRIEKINELVDSLSKSALYQYQRLSCNDFLSEENKSYLREKYNDCKSIERKEITEQYPDFSEITSKLPKEIIDCFFSQDFDILYDMLICQFGSFMYSLNLLWDAILYSGQKLKDFTNKEKDSITKDDIIKGYKEYVQKNGRKVEEELLECVSDYQEQKYDKINGNHWKKFGVDLDDDLRFMSKNDPEEFYPFKCKILVHTKERVDICRYENLLDEIMYKDEDEDLFNFDLALSEGELIEYLDHNSICFFYKWVHRFNTIKYNIFPELKEKALRMFQETESITSKDADDQTKCLFVDKAMPYWNKLIEGGFVSESYKLKATHALGAYIAYLFGVKIGIATYDRSSWKPFEILWDLTQGTLANCKKSWEDTRKLPIGQENIDIIFEQ